MVSNHFKKLFYISLCVWLHMENRIFQKNISFDRKIKALTRNLFLCFYFHFKPFSELRRVEREREREPATSRNQTRRRDRPAEIAPHEAYCRLTGLILLWVRSSPPLGRSRHLPLVDLSSPLGQSCRRSAFSL